MMRILDIPATLTAAARAVNVVAAALLVLVAGGCATRAADGAATAGGCELLVIVAWRDAAPGAAAAARISGSVAAAAGVRLVWLREVTAGVALYRLSAAGSAADCQRGLMRLQAEERVRYAEPDTRRQPLAP